MKNILKKIKILGGYFIDLIFPIECQQCGAEGRWVCEKCFQLIKFQSSQYCLGCKSINFFGEYCERCRCEYPIDGIIIAGNYENKLLAKLIKYFKYNYAKGIGVELGEILTLFFNSLRNKFDIFINDRSRINGLDKKYLHSLESIFIKNPDNLLIIPVPLSMKRLRWRGYNQAQILAEILANNFFIPLEIDALKRIRFRTPQAKLSEEKRNENIKNNFICTNDKIKGKNIILIDDVVTTGATLNECARVLKSSGAKIVWGLVVAKG